MDSRLLFQTALSFPSSLPSHSSSVSLLFRLLLLSSLCFSSIAFSVETFRLLSPHPSTSLSPSVTAFQEFRFYACKYSSSPASLSGTSWLLPLCCLHGARPSALIASAASPSAASVPRRSSLPFPRTIALSLHTASFCIPSFPSARVPSSSGPELRSCGPSSAPRSVSAVIRSLRGLLLRRAPCLHTRLSSPLVACSASQWHISTVCSLVLLFVSVALCYLFFKRRSAASGTPLLPQEQQQVGKHAAASWTPVSLRPLLHRVRSSFSAAGAPAPTSTPSAAGGAAARTTSTLRPTSAVRTEAVYDGTAAVRVATGCSALLASPSPTLSRVKASHIQLDSAITDPPPPRCATASGGTAVAVHSAAAAPLSAAAVLHSAAATAAWSAAAAIAVHSALAAVQAEASSGSATRADRAGGGAGSFLSGAATGAEFDDTSPPALAVAFPESVFLKRLSLLFILPATADVLLAAAPSTLYVCVVLCTSLLVAAICRAESHSQREYTRVTSLSLRLLPLPFTTAAVCEDAGKRQRRKRHSRKFPALHGLCGVTCLAASFLILPAASCGCEANRHAGAFSSYHEPPLSPPAQHLYVQFPPRHAAPPASSSSHCRSGSSARTLRCSSSSAFDVPRLFTSFGFSFAAAGGPCFRSSSLPLFALLSRGRQLPSSAMPQHRGIDREKPSASLTSRVSGPLDCSSIHPPISFPLPATSHACIPGFLSFPAEIPSILCLPSRSLPCGAFLRFRTGVASSTLGPAPSSYLLVVSGSPPSGALSSGTAALPPSLSKSCLLTSCSLWQPSVPLPPSRSLHRRLSSCDFCYVVRRVCLRRKGRVELSLAAVRRHGRPGTGTQTTRNLHQDGEEEKEEEVLSRLPYVSSEDTEATKRPPARGAPAAPHYDFFTGSSALPPEESEEEEQERGERAQHLKTVLRKTSRFGSLTDPGEPPTPPPPSPFWPSYPPKKVSALPGGVLPRWHPRSPFPPLQPRGPFYPEQKRPQQESQRASGTPQEKKTKTEERDQKKESGKERDAGAGLPDKPPDLPKNYKHWVRDSRYEYPQFTTLTASLRYRRHLKRSSRKLDWRLKNVQFRRMYFAWRRNMRDQETHRWMREKMRWSKLAAEYWKREYTRQEEEWARKTRLQPRVKKEAVPVQEMGEVPAGTQERRPQEDSKLQPRPGERVDSSADEGLSVRRRESNASGELYDHKKEETAPTDARGGRRMRKSGPAQETSKKSGIGSAEKLAPASLSALDAGASSEQRLGKRTKDSVFHRREGKAVAEGQGTEVERSVKEEGLEFRDTGGAGENSELRTGGNLTPRDLASRVMSLLSPQEIKEIITNGYRLPPLTAAVAASPIPWWASCKGEHKWRGRKTATNVQSRWVNWANPHRLVEAAVGRCWLPREGGVLNVLRERGEELAETLERMQRGEDIAGFYRHPEGGEQGESKGGQQNTLDRWSNEAQSVDEVLRKMWKRKKMQKGQEGREREEATKGAEDEDWSSEPVSLPEADTPAACSTEQAENDGEAGGRAPQGDNQEKTAEKKEREAVAAGDVEEKEGERPGFECIDEGCTRQRAQSSCGTTVESSADALAASAMQHRPDTCATPSERNVDSPVSGYGVKSFLDDPEKQRKAIEAAIDVSLMLGHSTIVKTHGALVPYDVHSPFMRSHTSSRRRRMRLRGRERSSDKKKMTRQERRLANRDARLEQEKQREEAAKAAGRRAWEERQRLQSSVDPEG